ncbi:hypothetical protein RUM44_006716 [Polyplax serrata]|uniref:Ribosome biogenesis protein WDR12 homolog n=1 Tax=Polyplax serrata TaxID=468196 RepID=A0ABR1AIU8_POLSC
MSLHNNKAAQLQIRFITKEEQYAVPDAPFAVSSNIVVKELNALVNELLQESQISSHKHVDFEFLVDGELLRTNLQEHLDLKEISTENVVSIEYFQKHPAPEPQDCLLHDDWVGGVHVTNDYILTGCYDNTVQIWNTKGQHLKTVTGHSAAVKAVSWVSFDDGTATFVSGSSDQTAILWEWKIKGNTVRAINTYKGHERNIESLSVSARKDVFASGGWDSMLKVWSTDSSETENIDGETTAKRSRKDKSNTKAPKMTLKGHKDCISCVRFCNSNDILTSSWDHTLKLWDIEIGGIKQELMGNKAFLSADHSHLNNTIITTSADKHIRLYDPRSSEGSLVKKVFTSHTQWVQSTMWSKTNENLFISGAYDNYMKLWDWRSANAPLFDLTGHEDKVLCCDWSEPKFMVSGGGDNTVRIYKSKHVNTI